MTRKKTTTNRDAKKCDAKKFDDDLHRIYVVDYHDLMVASWHIATLIYGPDDDSIDRDVIECQIQDVMARYFNSVHNFGRLGNHGTTAERIAHAREFLRREEAQS